jgi:glycine betaine/choline ABC-type transport system substrate-binding protein
MTKPFSPNRGNRQSTLSACRKWKPGALLFSLALLILLSVSPALPCVGKALTIGIVNSPQEIIYAELIAQMVIERTGTTVDIHTYKDVKELYGAVKKGEVGIIIENTERGMQEVALPAKENGRSAYEAVKLEYRERFNLIWLEPVSADGGSRYYAPVILVETMGNLPALPKLINRLTSALTEENYTKLTRAVKKAEKPRQVARDFLKANKLI